MLEKDKNCIEFSAHSMVVTHMPYQEDTEIAITGMIPGREILAANNPFDIPCDVVILPKREFERLQAENEQLKQDYVALSKLVGFSSVEKIQDYLANDEAECDTLKDALANLRGAVVYANGMWAKTVSKLTESEKDRISERDKATVLEQEAKIYSKALQEWKEDTGCPSPSAAKTLIESGMSWHHAYNEVKEQNQKLADKIKEWKEATDCPAPYSAKVLIESGMEYARGYHEIQEENQKLADEVKSWQKATGYDKPKNFLKWKANIEGNLEAWKFGTGCEYPANARILLEKWKVLTKCETPEAAATWIASYESACERGNKLAEEVESWQRTTDCKTPEEAETTLRNLRSRIDEIKTFAAIASNWTDRIVEV